MAITTLRQESIRLGHFYVPQFEVKIEGVGLPRDILRDVVQVTYKDNVKELDSFELTVNNWDPTKQAFKYVGAESAASLQGRSPDAQRYRLFEPCRKKITVQMGYGGASLQTMITGTTTTMEPSFPQSGGSTLTVRGLNSLHALRKKQYTTAWPAQGQTGIRDSDIALNIATLRDPDSLSREKRFPMSIVVNQNARGRETPIPYVTQKNQYDIDFLFARARQRGYVVYIMDSSSSPLAVGTGEQLYFGPSEAADAPPPLRNVTFELKRGLSLLDFKPTLTTANQVKSVTVRGWNRRTRRRIRETATVDDSGVQINGDLLHLLDECDQRDEIVVNEPVFTPGQASTRATALLLERLKQMVQASGTCIGLPDLRAGQKVQIAGVGSRFSGTYFVTATTHTINDKGYITKFTARREDTG